MLPLTSSAVTTEFLADRPFLLLNAPVFETRYVGSLLAKGAVKSKGGIALPTEIWLKIFEIMLPPQRMSKYYLARAITATFCGDSTTVSCEIEQSVKRFLELLPPLTPQRSAYGITDSGLR